jgi:GMP synthase (glutamine-hydrolysing)
MNNNRNMAEYAEEAILAAKKQIGDGKVLLALSGGVDSSVVAALLEKAVGSQLTCIFVDTGLMRKNEGDEVAAAFAGKGLKLIRLDAETRFLEKLKDVADPEQKRKIIGEEFIRVFEEEAKKLGQVDFLAQGTIYPDIVESNQDGKVVKSHHNVGGLPEKVDFKELVEPLKDLYKPEVRELGRVLGLPDYLVNRQPFPGPGLGVRVIGPLTKEKLDLLREADFIFREEIANAGLAKELSQYFAILTGMRSVGVRGGERTYDYTLALRAIKTPDFMTADVARLPWELLEKVCARITSEVPGINRIVYDITPKPPATIEWE